MDARLFPRLDSNPPRPENGLPSRVAPGVQTHQHGIGHFCWGTVLGKRLQSGKLLVLLVSLLVNGCLTGGRRQHQQAPMFNHQGELKSSSCPMKIPGVRVVAEDLTDGVAIRFSASFDKETELRIRVNRFGTAQRLCSAAATIALTSVRAEAIEGGVRLVIQPQVPDQLDALRNAIHRQIEKMSEGRCPMSMVDC